jgi:hypothetical protein
MSLATGIVRWKSTNHPSRWGAEIADFDLQRHRLEAELDRRLGALTPANPAFVFTALESTQPDDIATAISRASDFSSGARFCVALDQPTLAAMDAAFLRSKNVGIVLDQVDSNTPLSAIGADLIVAIRFKESFVLRSTADARSACILDAMLRLAHDLGLATLANAAPRGRPKGALKFDYVSASSTTS